jgi:hypothetical protein
MNLNEKRMSPDGLMLFIILVIGFFVVLGIFLIPDEEKPNPIRNEQLKIVEDTLSVDDSRIVSRVTVDKQKFIIFKLGRSYYAFEEQK